MKRYPRFLAVIISLLFVFGLILTVFGIHTKYGDVNTTVFLSANESNTGTGLSSELMLTFLAPEGSELDDDTCKDICSILKKRLQSFGITDAIISYDLSKAAFSVKLSYNSRTTYDVSTIYEYLGAIGAIEIRAGNEKDDDGMPAGETAKTIIASNDDLRSVSFSVDDSSSSTKYICDIKYGGETKNQIRNYTEQVMASEDNEDNVYSIWIDNNMITSRSFSSEVKNGVVPAGTGVYTDSSLLPEYTALQMFASSKKLPVELSSSVVYDFSDPGNHPVFTTCLVAVCIALGVFGLVTVFRYKLAGFSNFIGWIGFMAVSGIVVSGGFDPNLGIYVSKRVLSCFLTVVLIFVIYSILILERIKKGTEHASSYRAVTDSYSLAEKDTVITVVLLVGIAIVIYLLSRLSAVFLDLKEMIVSFAVFALIGYLTIVLGGACITKSLASTQSLSNEKYYGG